MVLAVILISTMGVTYASNKFEDVPENAWYQESLDWASSREVIQGTGENKFSPNEQVSRGMLVTALWRMEGEPCANGKNVFVDIKPTEYYASAADWAAEKGIVKGIGNQKFDPNGIVSREQVAAIFGRYLRQYAQVKDSYNYEIFADDAEIASYAKEDVYYLRNNGILQGTGENCFNPKRGLKRAALVTLLERVNSIRCEELGVVWKDHMLYTYTDPHIVVVTNNETIRGFRKVEGKYYIAISNPTNAILVNNSENVRFSMRGRDILPETKVKNYVWTTGRTAGQPYEFFFLKNGDIYVAIAPKGSKYSENVTVTKVATGLEKVTLYDNGYYLDNKDGEIYFAENGTISPEGAEILYKFFKIKKLPREGVLK